MHLEQHTEAVEQWTQFRRFRLLQLQFELSKLPMLP